MGDRLWEQLADAQSGLISHRQLRELGVGRGEIRNHVRVGRWAVRSGEVVSTTTGPLSTDQALWLGVLHGGPSAMVGALSAASVRGLARWGRDEVTILVSNPMSFEPLPGYRFFRTRRPYKVLLGPGELPACRLEPAVLMFAAHEPHLRTALGAVAATVQQRLTTAEALVEWIDRLAPLRRSRDLRALLEDVSQGAHSMAEVDLRKACRTYGVQLPRSQRTRTDNRGRRRYTDAEWLLPDGRALVLEVDGGWHDDPAQSTSDRRRNRQLTTATRVVVQCSAWELRHEPWEVMQDLVALGVPTVG
ncbi:hypothetical protein ASC64_16330 [Nocardioides sp. Root122]|uniref:hypothetical protein n=1 Tax=Nocardioides TaxID=1839 RepID=UPI00070388AF|nr:MULTISPECIES: hypothetical protein [Nocardioides]KQV64327.1 hypothetical protein ASC64_16330 [Nocardioides sp. Root122]MCK9824889.1 endonuclease domain-containing protein [Nocardioides cavernae]